jgi:acyl dehydratase
MKFAELLPGLVIETPGYVMEEPEIVEFATRYDPQWFHVDPRQAASDSKFGGLIASGWHTCGVAMRLVADKVLAGSESFASPGLQYVKWPSPVRPGDTHNVRVEVLESRVSASRPTLGIVRWHWQALNQYGTPVMELEATSMFDLAMNRTAAS